MNVVAPGKYIARIKNYGVRTVKSGPSAGDPAPTIQFQIRDEATAQMTDSVFWQGSFKEGKARDIALEALFTCGMTGELFNKLAEGPISGALDLTRDLQIDVINEVTNVNGVEKTYAKVAWINTPGGAAFQNLMTLNDFTVHSARMGLQAAFQHLEQSRGIQPKKNEEEALRNIPF